MPVGARYTRYNARSYIQNSLCNVHTTSTKFAGKIPSLPPIFPVHLRQITQYLNKECSNTFLPVVGFVTLPRNYNDVTFGEREVPRLQEESLVNVIYGRYAQTSIA
jgi:hypothetical protein